MIKFLPIEDYKFILNNSIFVGTDIMIQRGGKFLLVKRKDEPAKGKWWFPGGRVMKGETVENCVLRRCKEETGLDVEIKKFINFYNGFFPSGPFDTKDYQNVTFVFLVESTGDAEIKLDDTSAEYKWIEHEGSPEELFEKITKSSYVIPNRF